jgi:hypothetical protein
MFLTLGRTLASDTEIRGYCVQIGVPEEPATLL